MLTLKSGHRYPVPDWDVEYKLAEALGGDPGALDRFWADRGREWVRLLTTNFGEKYKSHESPNFWLICTQDAAMAALILRWAEKAFTHLKAAWGEVLPRQYGRIPVLAFADLDAYYDYISEYHLDGEHPASGGVFLFEGYGHFAFCFHDLNGAERVITHELMHALLSGLEIPLWLNEGMAQVAETSLLGHPLHDLERLRKTAGSFWNRTTLEEFWAGKSFGRLDHGQMHSYYLAFLITRRLAGDMPSFRQFVKTASKADGGRQALYDAFGLHLEDLVVMTPGLESEVSGRIGDDWKIGGTVRY